LLADTRWPLTPINGAIVLLAVAETEKDTTAQQIGLIARQDLDTLEIGLGLRFPVYTLFADLHALPGAGTFLSRFAAERSGQRLGKGFPLNPDIKPEQVTEAVESNVEWVFGTLLPYWSLKLSQVEVKADETESATRANADLFRFQAACRDRAVAAARLVSRAVADGYRVPVFGGAYLTANSPDNPGEALFATDFFKKVESTQGYVAWTADALAADAGAHRSSTLGYAFLVLLLLAVAALGVYVWWEKWR
jgi:type VI protein secretion system component VasK